ncbi:Fur family transcriptional regulator [Ottowia sp. SB7-C50]|uniref:Fur family transcriptional regulator n=1 Tax=Ottowia sp. SB7-C50 TaxID=3081231 RepID=UPI0029557EFA|nr:Fur family transcriptional regulator [Ottowia sp. SB7-C50]WOP15409.1 Fur family transcriptional regulator [Ottowia sp. SB7-C50]
MPAFDPATLGPRLHRAGLRSTRAVLGVAGVFSAAGPAWAPTHADVAAALAQAGEPVNAVTLYRLLDRLVAAGLLARHTAPGERAWRFRWQGVDAAAAPAGVPHFECDACHTQFPLQGADAPTQAVADALRRTLAEHGHTAARVDLAVHGTCAGCRDDGEGAPHS